MSATNWKNVNNWHWVEKNCLPWATDYLREHLIGVDAAADGAAVRVSGVTEVTGDCDLNQRKGKIITIFDLVLSLTWEGTSANGERWTGRISVPEFMHDSGSDIAYEVVADDPAREAAEVKELARVHLTRKITEALKTFGKDLVDAHSKDVYIPQQAMQGHPVLEAYKPAPPVPRSGAADKENTANGSATRTSGATMKLSTTLSAAPEDIFRALTDPGMAQAWSRAPARLEPVVGGQVALFDGNITGKFEELVPAKRIVQTWRLRSWPADHFSKVTISLEPNSRGVSISVVQENVPQDEIDRTKANWNNYYWDAMRKAFGY